jgi:hypothetical protein
MRGRMMYFDRVVGHDMEWVCKEISRNDDFRNSPQDTFLIVTLFEPQSVKFVEKDGNERLGYP